MSNAAVPPPPPPSSPSPSQPSYPPSPGSGGGAASSGLPTWGKVAIGCGCLVALVAVAGVALLGWGAKKAVDIASDPAKAAEVFIKAHPDFELVENDRDAGTITIRNEKTGEVGTFDYSEIKKGNFTFEGDQGKVEIGGETGGMRVTDKDGKETNYKVDQSDGGLKITSEDGEMRLGQSLDSVPDWVPLYPEADFSAGGMTVVTGGKAQGTISATDVTSSLEDLESWYKSTLEDSFGCSTERMAFESGGDKTVSLTCSAGETELRASLVDQDGARTVAVTYAGPAQ